MKQINRARCKQVLRANRWCKHDDRRRDCEESATDQLRINGSTMQVYADNQDEEKRNQDEEKEGSYLKDVVKLHGW